MTNDVFANGREVACRASQGKSICAFPDVCFTPPDKVPPTPPGVPIPYPNTGLARDTTRGSRTVKISGKEVMLKNRSFFKKSLGDEAGCATKKGIITTKNRGKVYFAAWSMDVKFEGQNAVRHLDLTTHNHASFPGNSPTWPFLDSAAFSGSGACAEVAKEVNDRCAKHVKKTKKGAASKRGRKASVKAMCDDDGPGGCKEAMKCVLSPYDPRSTHDDGSVTQGNCCPGETPHHVVPKSQFAEEGGPLLTLASGAAYNAGKAPCVCVEGNSHSVGKHGEIHGETNTRTRTFLGVEQAKKIPDHMRWPVTAAERIGAEAVEEATGCPKACTQAQLRAGHKKMGVKRADSIRPTTAGGEAQTGPALPLPP
jgi:hypothetical protein